jgi:glycerophosphoryl diester phosphodiesterase
MPIVSRMIERVLTLGVGIIIGVGLLALVCAAPPMATSAPSPVSVRRALDTCTIPQAVAHRGGYADGARTENTLNAYIDAWKYGLLEWETDIRFDVNGIPFLMHDDTIDRTTNGTGPASAVNIATTTVKMNDGSNLSSQTLAALLDTAAEKGATVAIEPKVVATSAQVGQVGLLLNTYDMRDRVLIDSFYTTHLAPLKAAMPDLTYGLVSSNPLPVADVLAVGPVFNVGHTNLTQQWVDDYHAAGIKVYVWTLDQPNQWAPYRTWGIDRYVSNRPQAYRGWRSWVCSGEAWAGEY